MDYENWRNSLAINLTNKCDTVCKYCFQDSRPSADVGPMRFEHVKRVLRYFDPLWPAGREKYLFLTGGEVTLHPDLPAIVRLGLSYGWTIRLQTNGIRLGEMHERELKNYSDRKIIFKISLDGWNEETHEHLRERGSFQKVVRGIAKLRRFHAKIAVKAVVHNKNFPEFQKIIEFVEPLGVIGFSYNMLREEGRCREIERQEFNELDVARKLVPLLNQPRYAKFVNGTHYRIVQRVREPRIVFPPLFYVDYDGTIYSDQRTLKEDRIGSIFDGDLSQAFRPEKIRPCIKIIPPEMLTYVRKNLRTEAVRF
jgi:MoaA/NifB/PqqE/SkfB family radical SAM enzyme